MPPVIFTEVNMVFNSAFTSDFQRTVIHVHEYKRSLFTTCYSFSRLCAIRSTLKNDASPIFQNRVHTKNDKRPDPSRESGLPITLPVSVIGLHTASVPASYLEGYLPCFYISSTLALGGRRRCYEMGYLCQVRYHILVTSSCASIGGATRYKPCYSASSTGKQCSITSAICAKVNP
jgi:hypothetical protein